MARCKMKTENQIIVEKLHVFQGREKLQDKGKMMCDFFNKKNRAAIFSTSILFMALAIFWTVFDLISGANIVLQKPFSLAGNIVLFTSSALMFAYQLVFWGKRQYKPIIFYCAYYTLVIVSVTFLSIGNNIEVMKEINEGAITAKEGFNLVDFLTHQRGISLSTLCLLCCSLAPLPRRSTAIYLMVIGIVECFLPWAPFIQGHEVYPIAAHVVTRLCFAALYFFNLITERKRCYLERHLELLSYTDEITKSLNRTALETYLGIIKENNKFEQIGVILFDIDDFKKYNDTYSHPEGDVALKKVISIVFDNINKEREMLFRYGGEEFVILVPNTTKEETIQIANKVRKAVEEANIVRYDGANYPYITITIGCDLATIKDDFIGNVDAQLYIGKRNKKNCVVFNGEVVSK